MALITEKKIYFEFVDLGALKVLITFHFESKAAELKIDPSSGFGFLNIAYSVMTSVAAISDSPVAFKELILTHTFTS